MTPSVTRRTISLGMAPHEEDASGANGSTARMGGRLHSRAPCGAVRRWAVGLSLLVVGLQLGGARPALADGACKPAAPSPQSKCNEDAQCCPGLVCAPAGSSQNNAETQCQPGCRIGGTPVVCNAPGACQTATGASCRAGVCSYPPDDGKACDDGNACTQGDTCGAGACISGAALDCGPGNRCDPSQGCLEPCGDTFCPAAGCCLTGNVAPDRMCESTCSVTNVRACVVDSNCRLPECDYCQPGETCQPPACAVPDPRYPSGDCTAPIELNVEVIDVGVTITTTTTRPQDH
jgi:hypothetical protein